VDGSFTSASFETGPLAQTDLELMIFLPQPPEYWNCRHVPSDLATLSSFRDGLVLYEPQIQLEVFFFFF
jgi:hypothetical protein